MSYQTMSYRCLRLDILDMSFRCLTVILTMFLFNLFQITLSLSVQEVVVLPTQSF